MTNEKDLSQIIPNQFIVRFHDHDIDEKNIQKKFKNCKRLNNILDKRKKNQCHKKFKNHVITINDPDELKKLQKDVDIKIIEPDRHCFLCATPNDEFFTELWNMNNTGQYGGTEGMDISAPYAWDIHTDSTNVIIAVCDTGIESTHPDLQDNMWTNTSPTFGDIHGASFTPSGISGPSGPATDPIGGTMYHGTHVAGIIGARGNNTVGVVGVNWKCKLMSLQVFYYYPGVGWTLRISDAILAHEYAIEHNACVINNSWGGSGGESEALYQVFSDALDNGMMIVCAAGNSSKNNDVWGFYPANFDIKNNIAVASSSADGTNSWFSNYGMNNVEIAAPGGSATNIPEHDILSTMPDEQYGYLAGTSMAAPHITGAIGLLKSYSPTITIDRIKRVLRGCITPNTSQFLTTDYGGRLNLNNMLEMANNVREEITNISIQPDIDDYSKNKITWTNPTDPLFNKVIIDRSEWCYPGGDATSINIYSGTDTTALDTIDPLQTYGYRFIAVYADGGMSLPVYVRSRWGGDFFCPTPPAPYDFICDYWDEHWGEVSGTPLLEMPIYAQLWRCVQSKLATRQKPVLRPGALFRFYDTTSGTEPLVEQLLKFQSIKEISIFIEQLMELVKDMHKPISLFSTKFNEAKCWVWLDYYHFINTGVCRRYVPPQELWTYTWEDIKLKENWERIIYLCREVLNNYRVLFTGNPPYQNYRDRLLTEGWNSSSELTSDPHQDYTFPILYSHSIVDGITLPDIIESGTQYNCTGLQPMYTPGNGTPYIGLDDSVYFSNGNRLVNLNGAFNPLFNLYTELVLFRNSDTTHGAYIVYDTKSQPITVIDYTKTGYTYEKNHYFTGWTQITDTTLGGSLDDYPVWVSWWERPSVEVTTDWERWWFGNRVNFNASQAKLQSRFKWTAPTGELQCLPSWDWESYPVDFDVYLQITAGSPNSGWSLKDEEDLNDIPGIFPDDNTEGYLRCNYTTPFGSGSYDANPTQVYKLGGLNQYLGTITVNDNSNLEFEFSMEVEGVGNNTLPGISLCHVHRQEFTADSGWWDNFAYGAYDAGGNGGLWDFHEIEETADRVTHPYKDRYALMRCGSLFFRIVVVPVFNFCEEVIEPRRVPDIRGLDRLDDTIDIVIAGLLDKKQSLSQMYWEPRSYNCIIHQCPHPGALLSYDNNKKGRLATTYNSTDDPENIKDDMEGDIPKIVGMTVSDASSYLAENYPLWTLRDETGTSETLPYKGMSYSDLKTHQFSNDFYPGEIVCQNPDWRIRKTASVKVLEISVSDGPTQGTMMHNYLGRQFVGDVQDILDSTSVNIPYEIILQASDREIGSILSQLPAPKELYDRYYSEGFRFIFSISAGPGGTLYIPDLRGLSPAVAANYLPEEYDLQIMGYSWSRYGEGLIVSQSPSHIQRGACLPKTIYVTVSRGYPYLDDLGISEVKR